MDKIKLTPKQESFCLKYVETGNASEAYRCAYNADRMKQATVNRNAFALLANNKIATRLNELKQQNEQVSMIKRADILKRLKVHFNFDIRKLLTIENGIVTIKDSNQWDEETALCVESVDVGRDGQAKVTIVGKEYTINRICAMCGYDAPSRHTLNLEEMTDEEVNRLADAITNNE